MERTLEDGRTAQHVLELDLDRMCFEEIKEGINLGGYGIGSGSVRR